MCLDEEKDVLVKADEILNKVRQLLGEARHGEEIHELHQLELKHKELSHEVEVRRQLHKKYEDKHSMLEKRILDSQNCLKSNEMLEMQLSQFEKVLHWMQESPPGSPADSDSVPHVLKLVISISPPKYFVINP